MQGLRSSLTVHRRDLADASRSLQSALSTSLTAVGSAVVGSPSGPQELDLLSQDARFVATEMTFRVCVAIEHLTIRTAEAERAGKQPHRVRDVQGPSQSPRSCTVPWSSPSGTGLNARPEERAAETRPARQLIDALVNKGLKQREANREASQQNRKKRQHGFI
jgi:hypothetical protein